METLNILVVDDDIDFAEALTDVLEAENHRVDRCHTGEDAVQLFADRDYDLSFMDVKLPCKNGVESFLEIRSRKPNARVVMMTGYSMEQLLQQAVDHGAWAVMQKPLDMLEVLKVVAAVPVPSLVVIVDDESDFVSALTAALRNVGLRALVADGSVDVVSLLCDGATDLMIIDLRASLDGVHQYLRALQKQPLQPPAIIVTGQPPDGDSLLASYCQSARVEIRLKPCDPAEIARVAMAMVSKG